MKTVDFLDAVKARHNLPSDYAAAKFLGLTQAQVSRYRTRQDTFGDAMAVKVAGLLELPADYVLACTHAERTSDAEVSKVWSGLAEKLKKTSATTAALAFAILFTADPDGGAFASPAPENNMQPPTVYYVNRLMAVVVSASRKLNALFSRHFPSFQVPMMAHA